MGVEMHFCVTESLCPSIARTGFWRSSVRSLPAAGVCGENARNDAPNPGPAVTDFPTALWNRVLAVEGWLLAPTYIRHCKGSFISSPCLSLVPGPSSHLPGRLRRLWPSARDNSRWLWTWQWKAWKWTGMLTETERRRYVKAAPALKKEGSRVSFQLANKVPLFHRPGLVTGKSSGNAHRVGLLSWEANRRGYNSWPWSILSHPSSRDVAADEWTSARYFRFVRPLQKLSRWPRVVFRLIHVS